MSNETYSAEELAVAVELASRFLYQKPTPENIKKELRKITRREHPGILSVAGTKKVYEFTLKFFEDKEKRR